MVGKKLKRDDDHHRAEPFTRIMASTFWLMMKYRIAELNRPFELWQAADTPPNTWACGCATGACTDSHIRFHAKNVGIVVTCT
jgi:hypothetical protein